ncbi:hypothetical protein BZG36_01704 [Bifiguratus adelaidae]|uniref:Uncharacterized protein n=1 Tax=Bifiguratus adelaidae TaxID=1938954 RepID=A0A261Y4Q6_9FUNG|nr:hypothetical protein BZG36_01704 [Bifiguratus adelaidae]
MNAFMEEIRANLPKDMPYPPAYLAWTGRAALACTGLVIFKVGRPWTYYLLILLVSTLIVLTTLVVYYPERLPDALKPPGRVSSSAQAARTQQQALRRSGRRQTKRSANDVRAEDVPEPTNRRERRMKEKWETQKAREDARKKK